MNYAREAYEAYCRHTNWKSLATGAPLPQWDALPEAIQKAWEVSAAWLVGLFTGNGLHEHRLHREVRSLTDALATQLPDVKKVMLEAHISAYLERGVREQGAPTDVYPDWIYEARKAIKHQNENIPWLSELLAILGWQGGTVHQALNAVRRLVEDDRHSDHPEK